MKLLDKIRSNSLDRFLEEYKLGLKWRIEHDHSLNQGLEELIKKQEVTRMFKPIAINMWETTFQDKIYYIQTKDDTIQIFDAQRTLVTDKHVIEFLTARFNEMKKQNSIYLRDSASIIDKEG